MVIYQLFIKKKKKETSKQMLFKYAYVKCTFICLQRKSSVVKIFKEGKEKWDSILESLAEILHLGYFLVFSNSP